MSEEQKPLEGVKPIKSKAQASAKKKKKKKGKPERVKGQNEVAAIIAEKLSDTLTYDNVNGEWYQRTGNVFSHTPQPRAHKVIRNKLQTIKPSFAYGYLSGIYSFMREDLSLFEWSSDKKLIPLQNGLLDIKTGKLGAYRKSDRFRTHLPIAYNSEAKCPRTIAILKQIAGNDETYNLIIACLYVILTKRHDLQKYFELLGQGGTGKSTLVDLFTRLVGVSNRAVTDLKELENNRFESAGLYGKYLIVINDSARYGGDVSKLKAITGGDPLRNEVKNRQQAEPFTCEGIVVVAANEAIQSQDYSTGLSRRRLPIYLTYEITQADKARYRSVGGVGAVFDAELDGLLNLLLSQNEHEMIKLIAEPTKAIAAGKLKAELDTNPLLQWADENLVLSGSSMETSIGNKSASIFTGLYANYCHHCDNSGNKPVQLTRFSELLEQQLKSRGIETYKYRKSTGRSMRGLALRNINDTQTPALLSAVYADKLPVCDR